MSGLSRLAPDFLLSLFELNRFQVLSLNDQSKTVNAINDETEKSKGEKQ